MAMKNTVKVPDDVTNTNQDDLEEEKDEVEQNNEDKGQTTAPKRPLSPFIFYSQNARRIIK